MKAAFLEEQGSLDNLQVDNLPSPTVEYDDCCIHVHPDALNGFEPVMMIGGMSLKTQLPIIPCDGVAREVIEIGKVVLTLAECS